MGGDKVRRRLLHANLLLSAKSISSNPRRIPSYLGLGTPLAPGPKKDIANERL
jgi:hypothetical protein